MPLDVNLSDFATRVATESKSLRTLLNGNATDLSALSTATKTNLVAAINEVVATGGGAGDLIDDGITGPSTTWSSQEIADRVADVQDDVDAKPSINDAAASGSSVYSSTKTDAQISTAVANLISTAPDTLDTLGELASLVQQNETDLANLNRVRYDIAQTLSAGEQGQARDNIAAAAAADLTALSTAVGDTEVDLVATFEAGL